ncbi:hypothetical protein, partial [Massilia sp.]|uniref:hypothetical protein n=1 Tax=Massilia sp. TaxID=1882437 RepID=UPI003918F6FF
MSDKFVITCGEDEKHAQSKKPHQREDPQCGSEQRGLAIKQKTPPESSGGVFHITSLTITYFHTGCSTIIGAKSFHGPV